MSAALKFGSVTLIKIICPCLKGHLSQTLNARNIRKPKVEFFICVCVGGWRRASSLREIFSQSEEHLRSFDRWRFEIEPLMRKR